MRERYFFCGVDPAPSEGQKSDDGAIVVVEGIPRDPEELTAEYTDWKLAVVYARRVRKQVGTRLKGLSAQEWAGLLHSLHLGFRFRKICMDPNGGGTFVNRAMASNKTIINGAERVVTPIVTPEETTVAVGHFILSMFKRGDSAIEQVWPRLAGDDVLNDTAYAELRALLERRDLLLPRLYKDWPAKSMAGWSEERVWVLKNLSALVEQMGKIVAAVNPDGTWKLTARGARQFSATGKKDFVSATLMANVAFRSWLAGTQGEFDGGEGDSGYAGMF